MGLIADGSLNKCCATLVQSLAGINAPDRYNQMQTYGMLQALESPRNMAGVDPGIKSAIEQTWGKRSHIAADGVCKTKIRVRKPECGESTAERLTLCANTNTNNPTDDRVDLDLTITKVFGEEGLIEPTDYECLCDGGLAETTLREITKAAKKILRSVNLDLVDMVEDAMGNYIDGTNSQTSPRCLNLFTETANGFVVQPIGWHPLTREYLQMQTVGGVIAVGGNAALGYKDALQLTSGINPGSYVTPSGIEVFYDPDVQDKGTAPLPNWLYTWAPGSLFLMRWMQNVPGDYNIQSPIVDRRIAVIFGQPFDLDIHYDAVCNTVRWVLNYSYDLWNLPASIWADCLETNQKQAYQICCDTFACADFGTIVEEGVG